MPPQVEMIYDSAHIRVVHRPGASDFALISFSHAEHFVNDLHFWAESIAAKAELAAIGIVPYRSNWFPMAEMQRAAPAIRAALAGHRRIVGLGTSMGGYGALKYGQLLEMTHALAFVPQWSIDPADVSPWDNRFVRHFNPAVHHAVAIEPGDVAPQAAVLYDPFMTYDRLNFERIFRTNQHCTGIRAYFTAHSAITTFTGTDRMLGLIRLLLDGDFVAMQRRATEERRDKRSPVRPLALAKMMVGRNIAAAVKILDAHGSKLTPRQIASVRNDIAGALYTKGRYEDARSHSLAATELVSDRDFMLRLSMIEQKLGHLETALDIARKAVEGWPDHAGAHLQLSRLLLDASQTKNALAEAKVVLRLDPSNQAALKIVAQAR